MQNNIDNFPLHYITGHFKARKSRILHLRRLFETTHFLVFFVAFKPSKLSFNIACHRNQSHVISLHELDKERNTRKNTYFNFFFNLMKIFLKEKRKEKYWRNISNFGTPQLDFMAYDFPRGCPSFLLWTDNSFLLWTDFVFMHFLSLFPPFSNSCKSKRTIDTYI